MAHSDIGKIKSLALRDFLTYDELKFFPGDNLNIIIGPNGTGKSTIVAGIILGCGGKPALLSRSKDISDYVKNGKNKAHIEIELVSNTRGGVVTLHRTFDKNSKDGFSIDGVNVNVKEYLRRVKTFNIQVDNLCMFLPQDRVQDFTKLNPQELLHNTQISVCSPEINEAFAKLLKTRDQQKNYTKTKADLQTQLDDNCNRNEQLRTVIENNKLKDKLLQSVDILIKKKAWCEFEELRKKYEEVEVDMEVMVDKMKKKTDEMKPLQQKQQQIAGTKASLKNAISKAISSTSAAVAEMDKLQDATDNIVDDVNRSKQNMKNVVASVSDHKKQVREMELIVELENNELTEAKRVLTEDGDIVEQIQQIDGEMAKRKTITERLMQQQTAIANVLEETITPSIRNCTRKIAMLGDTLRQRVETLRNASEDTYKTYDWLQKNRQNFQGKIFNPVMTEITVTENDNAKYVENTVAQKDLITFVCTDKNDMKQLIKMFRNDLNLQVNFAYAEDTELCQYKPPRDISEYPADLGLYSYLIDMIDGPAPILNYLCKLYQIHQVAVGDDNTFKNASRVPNEFRLFFSTNHRFFVNVSKYSNSKFTSSSAIQSRNMLHVGVDKRLREREESNLAKWQCEMQTKQAERAKFQEAIQKVEEEVRGFRIEKKAVQQKVQKVKICEDKLRKKQAELENLKNRNIDVEKERKNFKNLVDSLITRLMKVNEKRVDLLVNHKNFEHEKILAQKKLEVFETGTGNLDEQIDQIQREINNTRQLYDRVKVSYDATKNRYKAKEVEALKLTDGLPPTDKKFKYHKQFAKIPDNLEELQNKVEDIQGRIECIQGVDPRVITEYEERSKAIEDLTNQLANEKNRLEKLEKDLQELHEKWYPAIQEIVETINANFSNFFNKMGFVGEIELTRKEERDYADYGIQIRVQYRDNEKLQALNRHVQSGGERAVAIAVYTLSLQHITSVPFRCVDEINQGMDPKNERKIFQMLVDITCQPGQSQYFFVTPKLLPDLPYSDLMNISVVNNGIHIEDPYIFLDEDESVQEEECVEEDIEMEDDE